MANALSVSASIPTVDTHRVAFCVTALCRDCLLQTPIVWSMTPALISIRLRFGTLLCGMRNQEDTAKGRSQLASSIWRYGTQWRRSPVCHFIVLLQIVLGGASLTQRFSSMPPAVTIT